MSENITHAALLLEQGAAIVSFSAILFWRRSSLRTRWSMAVLAILIILVLPCATAAQAENVGFSSVLKVLVLAVINAVLIAVWGLLAKVPSTDMVALGLICMFSAATTFMFLSLAMTPPRMF